jgi:hypothetical protein
MTSTQNKSGILSGNALKFIAAAAMICEHVGMMLLPQLEFLRIIGRLAFPIFAFMISEGAKHTKNRLRYLLTLAGFALIIQAVYFIYSNSLEMSIFVTFTLSVCMIYALDLFKSALIGTRLHKKIFTGLLFLLSVTIVSAIDKHVDLDYGFAGCMLPVFASLFVQPRKQQSPLFEQLDCIPFRLCAMAAGLLLLGMASVNKTQYYAFLSLPLLFLDSGKRGGLKTKYFFYIFYPAHLLILYGVYQIIGVIG